MKQTKSLFVAFLKNPVQVGALCPSSRYLSEAITANLGIGRHPVVVELGPGTGAITGAIARKAGKASRVLAVELDDCLCRSLAGRFANVELIHDSASSLQKILLERSISGVELIVSGLPWAAFPGSLQLEIINAVSDSLHPGGCFTTFAYLQGLPLPGGIKFRRLLLSKFSRVETLPIVWRNIPPALIYRCYK